MAACAACASLLIGGGPLDMAHMIPHCVRLYNLAHCNVPDYPEIRQLVFDAGSKGYPDLEVNAVHSLLIMARKGDAEAVQIIQKLANSSDDIFAVTPLKP